MSVMRCMACGGERTVDLDWHCEDWDAERNQCMRCTEREAEENELTHQAAMAASEEE